jgi:hypothetical protein
MIKPVAVLRGYSHNFGHCVDVGIGRWSQDSALITLLSTFILLSYGAINLSRVNIGVPLLLIHWVVSVSIAEPVAIKVTGSFSSHPGSLRSSILLGLLSLLSLLLEPLWFSDRAERAAGAEM